MTEVFWVRIGTYQATRCHNSEDSMDSFQRFAPHSAFIVSVVLPCRYMEQVAHAGSSLADFSTLKMEAIRSSETSVQSTTSTRRHAPEDGILFNMNV
jgi:hypothetical protein